MPGEPGRAAGRRSGHGGARARIPEGREDAGRARPDPRTTVAIITRNRRRSLLTVLDHLGELPEKPPVIVVDNGSTDDTADAVRAHPSRPALLAPGRNLGAIGRNLAVQSASTPYVAFSDDDSWWAPGALRAAADLLDQHPRLALAAARTLVGPGEAEDPLNRVLADSPLQPRPDLPGRPVLGFLACASVVRRAAFLEAGGYHPLLFFGAEETLLAYDLAARDWGVCYTPLVVAHHHPDPAAARPGRSPAVLRNAVLTQWLRRPVGIATRHTAWLIRQALTGQPGAATALAAAAVRFPAALRHRKPLPQHVEAAARLLDP